MKNIAIELLEMTSRRPELKHKDHWKSFKPGRKCTIDWLERVVFVAVQYVSLVNRHTQSVAVSTVVIDDVRDFPDQGCAFCDFRKARDNFKNIENFNGTYKAKR